MTANPPSTAVCHTKLLIGWTRYGIKGNLYHWIAAFLSHRSQSAGINSALVHTLSRDQSACLKEVSHFARYYLTSTFLTSLTILTSQLQLSYLLMTLSYIHTSPILLPLCFKASLTLIQAWSTIWQLRILYPKCSILTIGPHQQTNIFQIDLNQISSVDHVCDLGITIDSKLKFQRHIHTIISRANHRKSLILRCFLSRNQTNLVRAFKTYVRPILEYASTVWSPSYITDIIAIERVQKNFTKRTPGCSHMSYPERLTALKLQSLEHRRLIADLTMVYNIIHDKISINTHFLHLPPTKICVVTLWNSQYH